METKKSSKKNDLKMEIFFYLFESNKIEKMKRKITPLPSMMKKEK